MESESTDSINSTLLPEAYPSFAPEECVSILIHASSKMGKSTLTSTAPTPILVLDAEGSWKFIGRRGFNGAPLRKVSWNPNNPPPVWNGDWDVCHVIVRDWSTLSQVYVWLTQAPHQFVSIVLDSVTEMQRRLKKNLVGTEQMKIQHWGELLTRMDDLIRSFRDLTMITGLPVRCVMYVAETINKDGKWRPYMQGQISNSMPYWVDICGYLFVDSELDDKGQPLRKVRKLLIGPHPQFETGERVQGTLPDVIINPHITDMLKTIFMSSGVRQSMQHEGMNHE